MANVTEKVSFELTGTGAFKTLAEEVGKIAGSLDSAVTKAAALGAELEKLQNANITLPDITVTGGSTSIDTAGLGAVVPGANAASRALGETNYEATETARVMREVNYDTGKTVQQFRDMDTTVGEAGNSLANQRYALYDAADAYGYVATMATAAYASTAGVAIMYEEQFSQVHRTAGLVGDEVGEMKDELIDLSRAIPASFGDLADVAAIGGQIGIAKEDLVSFTEVVTQMGTTTDLTLEESALLFGRFQTLLGTTADEFDKLGSAILEVGVDSAAGEAEIAKMSIELAAVAQQAGLTEVQLVALTGTLASAGIPAERGRSAVQNSFDLMDRAIRDNGEELENWAKLSGVSVDEFKAAWGTEDFMGIFRNAIAGLAEAGSDAGAVLDELGARNSRTRTSLMSLAAGVDLLDKSLDLAGEGWSSATALQEHFGIAADTVASRLTILKNEAFALFNELGRGFIDTNLLKGSLEVVGNVLWALAEVLQRVPFAAELSAIGTSLLLYIAGMSAFQRLSAIVKANSFALADSQKAMSSGLTGTREATKSLIGTLFTFQKAQMEVVETERMAIASKNLFMAATLEQRIQTQLATATQQEYNAVILQNEGSLEKARKAIATHEANLDTASVAVVSAREEYDKANASMHASAVATTTASKATATAVPIMDRITGSAKRAGASFMALGASIRTLLPQIGIITLVGIAIDKITSAFRRNSQESGKTVKSIEGLSDALAQDTAAWEENGEAVAVFASAVSESGETLNSEIVTLDENVNATQLLTDTKDELASKSGQLATILGVTQLAQYALGEEVKKTTGEIDGQIVAIGEATMALMKQNFIENPLEGNFQLFPDINADNWSNVILQYERMAEAGLEGAVSIERIAAASMDLDGKDAQEMADSLENYYNEIDRANDELFNLSTTHADIFGTDEYDEKIRELQEELDYYSQAVHRAEFALALLDKMSVDFEGPIDGLKFDELVEGAMRLAFGAEVVEEAAENTRISLQGMTFDSADAVDAHIGLADALYAFGGALFENGNNFDIYTAAGRTNMEALSKSVNAAVTDAGGDATVLVANLAVINQALVDNGVEAALALDMVTNAYNKSVGGVGIIAMPMLRTRIQQTVPVINGFGLSVREGYADAMDRANKAGRNGGAAKGAKDLGDAAKKAKDEVRTLADYVSDLSKVMNRTFELRWGHMQQLDDTADAWQSIKNWAEDAAQSIEDARDEINDAKKAIRDIKNEIKGLDAELADLQAQEAVLKFQLQVAVDYGDGLRARQIEAELLANQADQSVVIGKKDDAKSNLDDGQKDLTKATKELSEAQKNAQRDLNGTSESAREQRDMVWDLLKSYQDQIQTYADTGASTQDLEQYTKRLRSEFEDQLRQLGYNQTEVKKYSTTFEDLTKVIQQVPRNITVSINNNPALTALNEYRAGLSKTDTALKNTKKEADKLRDALGGAAGASFNPLFNDLDKAEEKLDAATLAAKKLRDELLFNNTGGGRGVGGVTLYAQWLSKGGLVEDVPGGGMHPAARGTDTVPAMLTPGEYVIPRDRVESLGVPFLNALRSGAGQSPVTGSTYVHSSSPGVQVVELMPHQMNAIISTVSQNVGRAMVSGADLSVAVTRANGRAVRAGAN